MASEEFRKKLQEHLRASGYYEKTPEQRLKEHKECYKELSRIEKGDYYKGREYLDI